MKLSWNNFEIQTFTKMYADISDNSKVTTNGNLCVQRPCRLEDVSV